MTTSIVATADFRDGCPLNRPKVSIDVVPSGSVQYQALPTASGVDPVLVIVTTDVAIWVDFVGLSQDFDEARAVPIRPPTAGVRDYQFYISKPGRLGFTTI